MSRQPRNTSRKASGLRSGWPERFEIALGLISRDKKQLAEIFSVVPRTIDSWTSGRTEPAFRVLVKVRDLSGVSLDWILAEKGPPHISAGDTSIGAIKRPDPN